MIRRLTKWLAEHRNADTNEAAAYTEEAREATKEPPATEELVDPLWQFAEDQHEADSEETADGYFNVKRVERERVHLTEMGGKAFVVKPPVGITTKCKVGWSLNLELGKAKV